MKIKAVNIKDFDFKPYGNYFNMFDNETNVSHHLTDEFEDHMSKNPLIDTPAHLGLTVGSPAPYVIKSMEKHFHTKESIFCAQDPIVLCVAISNEELAPRSDQVKAVILNPGDVVILNRHIWHDACHGLNKKSAYYYIASPGPSPAEWVKIVGEELTVEF